MPDNIERTIYKLEIDDSGYIRGIDSLAASTNKFTESQNRANERLKINEQALKDNAEFVEKTRKALEAYTGTNERYRKQLEKSYGDAQKDQIKLNDLVIESRKSYEQANKAAQDFADTSARATQLQQQTTGGKIPTAVPLGIQSNVVTELQNIVNTGDLSGLPEILAESSAQFEKLRQAITEAEEKMKLLNATDQEFIDLQAFVAAGKDVIEKYDNAVRLSTVSTAELTESVKAAQLEVERISAVSPSELPAEVAKSKVQFDELQISIAGATDRLAGMDDSTDEFKSLEQVVIAGRAALDEYNEATTRAGAATQSYRAQIAAAQLELKKLQESGTATTQQIIEQEKVVVRLTDAYQRQQERIRILASNTRALDFGKDAIQAAISGFQAYTAVSILAGGASEKLQKQTIQLFAAMQLLASLEQLATVARRLSVNITDILSAAQKAYTFAISASTVALRVYRVALLSTGIGAAVVLFGALVNRLLATKNALTEAAEKQKLFNEVMKEANQAAGKQLADLKVFTQTIKDSSLPIEERLKAVRELQATFPDYFASMTQEAILTGDITKQTEALTIAIQASSRARAAKGKIDAIEAQKLDNEFQRQKIINATNAELARVKPPPAVPRVAAAGGTGPAIIQPLSVQQQKDIITQRREEALADVKAKDDALDRQEQFLLKFVDAEKRIPQPPQTRSKEFIEGLIKNLDAQINNAEIGSDRIKSLIAQRKVLQDELDKAFPKDKKTTIVDNTFEEERLKLTSQLSELRRTEIDDIQRINDAFIDKLAVERKRIEGLIKDKKVTGNIVDPKSQAGILFKLAVDVNKAELDKALADFNKKVTDAREKLNTEIAALQLQADRESILLNIAAIQDDFDRRAALIDFNEKKEIEDAKLASQKRLDALELNRLLIGEEAYQDARFSIIETGEQNVLNLTRKFAEERNALAEDKFFEFLTFIDDAVNNINLEIDEALAKEIQGQSDKFVAGKISFEQYQKAISEIQRRQENIRRDRTLFLHKVEIEDLEVQLNNIDDKTSKKYIRLQEKLKRLREKYAKERQANAQGDAADTQTDDEIESARLAKIRGIADAIGEVTNSIISFWQQANAAEAAALDRSISLQEKRVDAAQRIAERGNAQYLKAESDRLKELQVARENAARRELAINAALQASQLLVGITGAITKIATPGVGTADVIAAIAVIFGALATGYGLVKSLQGNQPRLKKGTTYVARETHPVGEDTIPAWLTEGEAVIPAARNKNYKRAVEAIYHEKIPAKVLNEFVENYVKNRKETKDSFVNNYTTDVTERKAFSTVQKVVNIVTNRLNNVQDTRHSVATDKVFSENKTLVDNRNISAIVSKIVNEISETKLTVDRVKSFIESYAKDVVDRVIYSRYKSFVDNVAAVPVQELDRFINTYQQRDVTSSGDQYEYLNNYIDNRVKVDKYLSSTIQTIAPVPQPNYQRIKEAAETHISSDGKLAGLLVEQNRLLIENTDVQRATMRALQKMGVSVNMDKNGIAVSVMEVIEQVKKDSRA